MKVPVKVANGRRRPVPKSNPTYDVELTREEMIQISIALKDRIDDRPSYTSDYSNSVSALAMIQWRLEGRR